MAEVEAAGNSGVRMCGKQGGGMTRCHSLLASVRHLVGRDKEERKKEKTARIQGKTQHSSPSS